VAIEEMLTISAISKTFGRRRADGPPPALNDVSFSVSRGRICGLLGHNGAGKSTALGIMLGMVYPDSGEVSIDGCVVQRNRERAIRKVGAIFETPAFYEYLSGWHNLRILSSYSGGVDSDVMRETVAWVGLEKRIRDRVSTYSHGMRQRLALAQALLPQPELLILDEPTDGLDPEGIVEFRRQLLELRDRLGLTVLLSSHLLSEVEQVCDEVVILQEGEKVYEGKVKGFEEREARFRIEADSPETMRRIVEEMGGRADEDEFVFDVGLDASKILESLVSGGAKIRHFAPREDSLEALYLRFSRAEKEEAGEGEDGGE
jgi:ABC-2 type transport system ATP-binding protein